MTKEEAIKTLLTCAIEMFRDNLDYYTRKFPDKEAVDYAKDILCHERSIIRQFDLDLEPQLVKYGD